MGERPSVPLEKFVVLSCRIGATVGAVVVVVRSVVVVVLVLRGTIVNRTYDTHKHLYI